MSRPLVLKRVAGKRNTLALHDAESGEVLSGQMTCDIVNDINGVLHVVAKISLCGQNRIVGDELDEWVEHGKAATTAKQTSGDDTEGK